MAGKFDSAHPYVIQALGVDAVAGKEIHNAVAVLDEQLAPKASFILDVHAEQVKQCHPLRADVFPVVRCGRYR